MPNSNQSPGGGKIDLNTATADELQRISDIGPDYARRIIEARNRMGGFKTIDQLDQLEGFGQQTIDQLKASGCVGSKQNA